MLEDLVYDSEWPEDVVIDGKVMWRADDTFSDLENMNRMASWHAGITADGLEWIENELKEADTIVVFPTPVSDSVQKNIMKNYPDAAMVTLYKKDRIDVARDLQSVKEQILMRVVKLPRGKSYILPLTGFCYASILARDCLIADDRSYKMLLYDSYAGVHVEIGD